MNEKTHTNAHEPLNLWDKKLLPSTTHWLAGKKYVASKHVDSQIYSQNSHWGPYNPFASPSSNKRCRACSSNWGSWHGFTRLFRKGPHWFFGNRETPQELIEMSPLRMNLTLKLRRYANTFRLYIHEGGTWYDTENVASLKSEAVNLFHIVSNLW